MFTLELEDNEAAFSMAIVTFHLQPTETFLIVGTGQDTTLAPRTCKTGVLHTYKIAIDGRSLELLHKVS